MRINPLTRTAPRLPRPSTPFKPHHGDYHQTQRQAEACFARIETAREGVTLLTPTSDHFGQGVIVTSALLAKGLEFDEVLIPEATAKRYCDEMDRNLLYIACTRAMHRLTLTHVGPASPFVPA